MKTYQIHLIRHGLTDGNLKGRYIGSTDCPLASQGIAELKKMAGTYEYPRAEMYYSDYEYPLSRGGFLRGARASGG